MNIGSLLHAYDDYISEKWFKASDLPDDKTWNFEFKNKEKKPVYIRIFRGEIDPIIEKQETGMAIGPSKGSQEKDHSYFRVADIDPAMSYEIWISYKPENNKYTWDTDYRFAIAPNSSRKQLFLTWEKNALRPQSGVKGATQSGIKLDSNITKKEIKKLWEKKAGAKPKVSESDLQKLKEQSSE